MFTKYTIINIDQKIILLVKLFIHVFTFKTISISFFSFTKISTEKKMTNVNDVRKVLRYFRKKTSHINETIFTLPLKNKI